MSGDGMAPWTLPAAFTSLLGGPAPRRPQPPAPQAPGPSLGRDTYVPTRRPAPTSTPTPAPAPKPAPAPAPKPAPPPPPPPPGETGGKIALDGVDSPWVKDPAFANDGQPIGSQRYMVFGDLRRFYLKGFDAAPTAEGQPGLRFAKGEIPIDVKGLPPGIDGLWAPEVVVRGDRVVLLYAGGKMPPGGLDWPSFRLRMADVPLADFEAAVKEGRPVPFQDKGVMFGDQTNFGGSDRFAMIDPAFYEAPDGSAYVTYTVVKDGIPGQRPHEEYVRMRRVDPNQPEVALGPDAPILDGWAGGRHDGVAEAQDVVTIGGKPTIFISSRAGDKDQKVYAAPFDPAVGRVPEEALREVLTPGGEPWMNKAAGSTGAAEIDGTLWVLHQGLADDGRFSLGFRKPPAPVA